MPRFAILAAASVFLLSPVSSSRADDVSDSLSTILAVEAEGQGNAEAVKAVRTLSAADPSALLPILKAFETANPLAQNWLRGAFEAIVDQAIESDQPVPVADLIRFIENQQNSAPARELAYGTVERLEPKRAAAMTPGFLSDPSAALRRLEIAALIESAEQLLEDGDKAKAEDQFQQALKYAVDRDQVETIVENLEDFGQEVDLQTHFGFLPDWRVIGPFDNRDEGGFDVAYPPETDLDPDATHEGQLGKVTWQKVTTDDDYGLIDIAKQIENHKGSVMYATTEFVSPKAQSVQFRLGTPNAWKIWVNGELVFAREEYHRGTAMDQYTVPVDLKKGENVILLKVLQNEQEQSWAQRYQYQLRVTDDAGAAVRPGD